MKDCTTDINTYLSENLSGMKITQVFNREAQKMQDFLVRSERLKRARQRQIFVFAIFRPMVYMLYIMSVMCLLYLGGRGYIGDLTMFGQTVTSAVIVSFYMYISSSSTPSRRLPSSLTCSSRRLRRRRRSSRFWICSRRSWTRRMPWTCPRSGAISSSGRVVCL